MKKILIVIRKKETETQMFFTFFKLYKWYQIAQRITNQEDEAEDDPLGLPFLDEDKLNGSTTSLGSQKPLQMMASVLQILLHH